MKYVATWPLRILISQKHVLCYEFFSNVIIISTALLIAVSSWSPRLTQSENNRVPGSYTLSQDHYYISLLLITLNHWRSLFFFPFSPLPPRFLLVEVVEFVKVPAFIKKAPTYRFRTVCLICVFVVCPFQTERKTISMKTKDVIQREIYYSLYQQFSNCPTEASLWFVYLKY